MNDDPNRSAQSSWFSLDRPKGVQVGDGNTQINIDPLGRARGYTPVSIVPPLPLELRDKDRRLHGRDELIGQLVALLEQSGDSASASAAAPGTNGDNRSCRIMMLYGPPGCGKTSVAQQVAYEAGKRQIETWWVNAVDSEAVLDGMSAVAAAIGAAARDPANAPTTPDLLWDFLRKRQRPWLLIVDGVDDPLLLAVRDQEPASGTGWIRYLSDGPGLVIVTTRDGTSKKWGDWWDRRVVGMLTPQHGALVLQDYTANRAGTDADARNLAERLRGLPLALKLAGAYLALTSRLMWHDPGTIATFAAYKTALDDDQIPFLKSDEEDLVRIWRLSIDLLERHGAVHAKSLMGVFSRFADAPIPYQLVLHPVTLAESGLFEGLDNVSLQMTVDSLAELGLVDLPVATAEADGSSEFIEQTPIAFIHPLVRFASRHFDSDAQQTASYIGTAAKLLDRATQHYADPEDARFWPQLNSLAPHCVYLLNSTSTDSQPNITKDSLRAASSAACVSARCMLARGLYDQAEAVFRTALHIQQMLSGEDDAHVLRTRLHIGCAMRDRDWLDSEQLPKVEQHVRAVCEAYERRIAAGSDQAGSLNRLAHLGWRTAGGLAYLDSDWNPDAAKQVLEMLTAYQQLAVTLAYLDKSSSEAKSIYQAVYEAQRRLLGDAHVDTLATRTGLAARLYYEGRFEEAEREFRAVCDADRSLPERGDKHPDTFIDRGWLAATLLELGRLEEAEGEYRTLVESMLRVLGKEHRDTIKTRLDFVTLLIARGRQILDGHKESGSPEGEGAIMTSNNSSASEPLWFEEAVSCFQEARQLIDPEKEPGYYGVILHDIAATYEAAEDLGAAIQAYQEAALYKRKRVPPSAGDLATTLQALAACLATCGEFSEAITWLDEADQLRAQTKVDNEERAVSLHSLAVTYQRIGDGGLPAAYDRAVNALDRALNLLDCEKDPGSCAAVQDRIGDIRQSQGSLREAQAAYKEAVRYMRQVPHEKDNLAAMLIDLGRVNRQLGRLGRDQPSPEEIDNEMTGAAADFGDAGDDAGDEDQGEAS